MKYMYPWAVPDPDRKIRGGRGARSSRPFDKGGGAASKKDFFRPFGLQFGLKIRGGAGPPGPLPWFRHCPWEILYSSH